LKSFFLWPQSLNHILLEITWTLSYELYFYLLFSLLILFSNPRNRNGFVLLAFVFVLVLNLYRHFVAHSFSPDNIYYLGFWSQFLTAPFLLEFFGGALVAGWLKKRPVGPALSWFLAGAVLFLAGGWINESVYSGLIEQGFHVVPRVFVYGLPACMLLAGLVRLERNADEAKPINGAAPVSNEREPGLRHTIGFRAPVRFSALAGGASYAIYLSHILILTVVWNSGFNQLIASWSGNMIIAAYLVLMLSVLGYSILHYVFLEKPLHRLFKRWIGLHSSAPRDPNKN
jgi:exopolysaccharide production protein ExoZ